LFILDERDARDTDPAGMPSLQRLDHGALPAGSAAGGFPLYEPQEVLV
jgi:hypothetical protein